MKTNGGGGIAQPSLTSALDGSKLLASISNRFVLWDRISGSHWLGEWEDFRVGTGAIDKKEKKSFGPLGNRNQVIQFVMYSVYRLRYLKYVVNRYRSDIFLQLMFYLLPVIYSCMCYAALPELLSYCCNEGKRYGPDK
jgi:hypothetical protein